MSEVVIHDWSDMPVIGAVYVMWAHDGTCLYVGRSVNLPARLQTHSQQKPWWSEVARIDCWHQKTYEGLASSEREFITMFCPRWNVTWCPDQEPMNLIKDLACSVDGWQFGRFFHVPLMTDTGEFLDGLEDSAA